MPSKTNQERPKTPKDKRQNSANPPNFLGTQTQIPVPRHGPASLNVTNKAPAMCSPKKFLRRRQADCTRYPSASHSLILPYSSTGTSFPDQLTAVTVPLCIMPRSIIDHRAVDRGQESIRSRWMKPPRSHLHHNTALTVKPSWTQATSDIYPYDGE